MKNINKARKISAFSPFKKCQKLALLSKQIKKINMTIKKITMWITNKIQAFNESSLFLLIAKKNMELQKKIWNFFEDFGYARAAAHLTRQGFYNENEMLMLDMKEKAIIKAHIKLKQIEELIKLERMKEIKSSYNPLGHYLSHAFYPFMSIKLEE